MTTEPLLMYTLLGREGSTLRVRSARSSADNCGSPMNPPTKDREKEKRGTRSEPTSRRGLDPGLR